MTAIASVHDRFSQGSASNAKIVGQRPPFWWVTRLFVAVAVIALCMLGVNTWRQSLLDQGFAQGGQSAQAELRKLRNDLEAATAELTRKQTVLDAEISRKNALAVENTKLKGGRDQATSDLKMALDKLKNFEAKKSDLPVKRSRRG